MVEIYQERVKIKYSGEFAPMAGDPVQIGFKNDGEFIEVEGKWRIVEADSRFVWVEAKGTDRGKASVGYKAVIKSMRPRDRSKL